MSPVLTAQDAPTQHLLDDALADLPPVGLGTVQSAADLQERVDIKYVIRAADLLPLADALQRSYARLVIDGVSAFRYRSVYLDTPGLACFHDHRQGRRRRWKARTRDYLDSDLRRLEVKLKDGRGRTVKHSMTSTCAADRSRGLRDFTFANAVRFWGKTNPSFFKGTVLERAAAEVLAESSTGPAR